MTGESSSTAPVAFSSKRDGWLVAVLIVVMVVEMIAALTLATAGELLGWLRVIIPLVLVLVALFVAWIMFGTAYRILGGILEIRSGPFRWRVPLESIDEVLPSRAVNSAPALSLDRMEIRHRASPHGLLVSPEKREEFIQALLDACPQLHRVGAGLKRG